MYYTVIGLSVVREFRYTACDLDVTTIIVVLGSDVLSKYIIIRLCYI